MASLFWSKSSNSASGRILLHNTARNLVRMSSTLVGQSGRVYNREHILQKSPKDVKMDIWRAITPSGHHYVLKPTSHYIFDFAQELKHEFENEKRLRNHVDDNREEFVLVYKYFMGNLLSLVSLNADIPLIPRKQILREIGLALKALHSKNYIHLDLKPNNVMLDWKADEQGQFVPTDVVLGDLDCAYRIVNEELLNLKMGNVMWRSPEGQAAKGVGKRSEMFSFGLMCLFTITGAQTLHLNFKQMKEDAIEPEHMALYRLIEIFGPAPPGLISHVGDDEPWRDLLIGFSEVVEKESPGGLFKTWDDSTFPNLDAEAKRFILRMTNLDPEKRATIDEIMEDPWWD